MVQQKLSAILFFQYYRTEQYYSYANRVVAIPFLIIQNSIVSNANITIADSSIKSN